MDEDLRSWGRGERFGSVEDRGVDDIVVFFLEWDWLREIGEIYWLAERFNDCLPGKSGASPTGEKRDAIEVMTGVMALSFCESLANR